MNDPDFLEGLWEPTYESQNKNPRPCSYFGVVDRRSGLRRECLAPALQNQNYCKAHELEAYKRA